MKKNFSMLTMALMVGVLFVAFVLTLMAFSFAHPVPWIILAVMIAIPIYSNRREKSFYVTWKDEYSVGIEAIDDDHKQLLYLINQLQTAVHYQTSEVFEKEALDAVVEYTKGHLAREEALMQKHGYPDFDAHKLEHEALIAKVGEFLKAYEQRGHDALSEVADYLRDWLIHHINGTDMAYAPFFKEKGVH
jgi:hemerythrin-like metal-binding protein